MNGGRGAYGSAAEVGPSPRWGASSSVPVGTVRRSVRTMFECGKEGEDMRDVQSAVLTGCFLFVAVLLCGFKCGSTVERLVCVRGGAVVGGGMPTDGAEAVDYTAGAKGSGMLALIDAVQAHVRSGGALNESFTPYMSGEQLSSTPSLPNVDQLARMLETFAQADESEAQVRRMAVELDLACRISQSSGCPAVHCLEAVKDSYRRMRLLDDQMENALAVPKASVRLLTVLPVAAVMFAELLGAHSLAFLFGANAGRLCLVLGTLIYMIGVMWMKILTERVIEAIQ